ncbi:serine/threonine-protein kinase [Streptomyces viridochromogenes]|uniref:serine/threonine-protein kinase n=1 Tax=Streptomyces viridochromogenes TaxID=1938 RepID=UPI00069DB144|nr:serine/threonine-protein kinase [Streptomyces viridochromogenes]
MLFRGGPPDVYAITPDPTSRVSSSWRVDTTIDGRYRVEQVHDQGAMGLVYRVRHLLWDTDLAVKRPRPEWFRNSAHKQKFAAEAETWVSLGLHPHVCTCHYVRTLDGVPCVFAEYVPGGTTLADWIADGRLYEGGPSAARARVLDLAIQTAWGLAHAHGRNLVHQDVKPGNVLVTEDGTAKVTDFGLAQARAAATAHEGAAPAPDPSLPPGVTVLVPNGGMSPAYASPEQADGRPLGRRSDIYSFAVSVFEMFTGGVSWRVGRVVGKALDEYLEAGGTGKPHLPIVPADLADLLARCLAGDPADRPRSMAEVAARLKDIHGEVTGLAYPRPEPVEADLRADELNNRGVSLLDLDRTPEAERAFTQALAADPRHLGATYNSGLLRWRRGDLTDEDMISRIEAVRPDAEDPWQARQLLAQVAVERGDLESARELLEEVAQKRSREPEVRSALRAIRSGRVTSTREVPRHAEHKSPSHRLLPVRLAPAVRLALTGGSDWIGLWDLADGRCLLDLDGHGLDTDRDEGRFARTHTLDLTPDGRFAVSASEGGEKRSVRFWDLTTGRCLRTLTAEADGIRLTPDGRLAVWGWSRDSIQVWDTHSGQLREPLAGHTAGVERVEVSADGRRVLSSGWDRQGQSVRLWHLASGRCDQVLTGHKAPVFALAFHPDERTAVIAYQDDTIGLWDLRDGRCRRVLRGRRANLMSFSADGRFLLAGDDTRGTVSYWDLESGQCLRTYQDMRINALLLDAARPGTGHAVCAETREGVRTWPLDLPGDHSAPPQLSRPLPLAELRELEDRAGAKVAEAEQAMAGGHYATAHDLLGQARKVAGHERAPRVMSAWWELGRHAMRAGLRTAWPARTLDASDEHVYAVDLTDDARLAVSAGADWTVRLWDLRNGTCLRELAGHQSPVRSVCLSPDGRRVLSGGQDGTVRLWDVGTGTCRRILRTNRFPPAPPVPVRFTADGRGAVVGGGDGAIRLWDVETGDLTGTLTGHEGPVNCLWAGTDGRLLASGGSDGTVRLWDLEQSRCVHVLEGHKSAVTALCVAADGTFALSAASGYDRTVRMWDVATGAEVRSFDEGSASGGLRITADGRYAMSAGASVGVWEVDSGRCVRTLDGLDKAPACLATTPDGRAVLSADGDGNLRSWALDWEWHTREPADWDDGALPHLEVFRRRFGARWTPDDLDSLLRRLQDAGYGWLRPEGVRARLTP